MNLRQLKYFIAVAEELNIGRAAARLNVSQPPVTRQIQQIEHELKARLFIRHPKGVELTQAGRVLLDEARNISTLVEQAGERVSKAAMGELGRLDVAIFGSAIVGFIPRIIHEYKTLYPSVDVVIHTLDKVRQVEALRNRSIDVGFNRLMSPEAEVVIEEIAREPILVAVSSAGPLAETDKISLQTLENEPLILFPASKAQGFVDVVNDLFRDQGLKPNISQVVGDSITALALVASGFGACLVPESVTSVTIPGVSFVPLDAANPVSVDLSCLYRERDSSPVLQNFLKVARDNGRRGLWA